MTLNELNEILNSNKFEEIEIGISYKFLESNGTIVQNNLPFGIYSLEEHEGKPYMKVNFQSELLSIEKIKDNPVTLFFALKETKRPVFILHAV